MSISRVDPSDLWGKDEYRDELNENTVDVCGLRYGEGDLLEAIDPIAFRCGYGDWLDNKTEGEGDPWVCDACKEVFMGNQEEEARECCGEEDEDA